MKNNSFRKIVCSLLRGEECDWPQALAEQEFIDFAQSQGILLLLSDHLRQIEAHWPKSVHQAVVIAQVAGMSLLKQRVNVVRGVFEILNQQQINAILFKGAANAYLLYPKPILRQHADIDVLIAEKDYSVVVDVLYQMGFTIDEIKPTKYGPYQTTATLQQSGKPDIQIDLHWKINNRLLLAQTLSIDEVMVAALPIQEYGEQVCGFNYHNALLAACIHEAGSLPVEREKLIGLYDTILLMRKLGGEGLDDFFIKAKQKQISTICLDYLEKALTTFGSEKDKEKFSPIMSDYSKWEKEPSSRLLKHKRSWLEDQRLDWLAVEGAVGRIGYIVSKFIKRMLDQ